MNDQNVSYTVKELIARLEGKIDAVLAALASKADRAELHALEQRVSETEMHLRTSRELSHYQRFIFGSVGVSALGAIATLVWLAVQSH